MYKSNETLFENEKSLIEKVTPPFENTKKSPFEFLWASDLQPVSNLDCVEDICMRTKWRIIWETKFWFLYVDSQREKMSIYRFQIRFGYGFSSTLPIYILANVTAILVPTAVPRVFLGNF